MSACCQGTTFDPQDDWLSQFNQVSEFCPSSGWPVRSMSPHGKACLALELQGDITEIDIDLEKDLALQISYLGKGQLCSRRQVYRHERHMPVPRKIWYAD